MNYLYNRAEPDGLTLANWNGALSLQQYLGQAGIQFDATKFEWLGSPIRPTPTCMISKSTGITTLKEWPEAKKPVKLGGEWRPAQVLATMREFYAPHWGFPCNWLKVLRVALQ